MSSWIKSPEIDIVGTIKWVPFHMLVFFVIGFILSKFQTTSIWIWPILGFSMILSSRVLRAFTQHKRKFRFDKWLLFWTVSHMLAIAISVQILNHFDVSKYIYILLVSSIVLSLFSQTIQTMFRKKDLLMLVMLILTIFLLLTSSTLNNDVDQYFVQSVSFVSSNYSNVDLSDEPIEIEEEIIEVENTPSIIESTQAAIEDFLEPEWESDFTQEIELAILKYSNEEKQANGLSVLEWDQELRDIAFDHSLDMAQNDFFDHMNLNGQDPTDRAIAGGYSVHKELSGGWYSEGIAENIGSMPTGSVVGYGYISRDADEIGKAHVDSWMDSSGHRANILSGDYDKLGVGVAYDGLYYVATQNFW